MSRKLASLLVGPNSTQQAKPFRMFLGDTRLIRVDLSALCGTKGTTVSYAAWSSDNGVSLSAESVTGYVVHAMLDAASVGTFRGKVTATLASGEVVVKLWRVVVESPDFAVLPVCPVLLTPANAAQLDTKTTATVTWAASVFATEYEVYLDDVLIDTVSETTYGFTGLTPGTTYEWSIIPVGVNGSPLSCGSRTFITDPLDAVIQWQSATFNGDLTAPSVTLVAVRSGNTEVTASADYDFTEGTALIGPDFTATPGTVTFAPSEVTKNVVVPLVRDYDAEVLDGTDNGNPGAIYTYLKLNDATDGVGLFQDRSANNRDFQTTSGETGASYEQPTLNLSNSKSLFINNHPGFNYSVPQQYDVAWYMNGMRDVSFEMWWKGDPSGSAFESSLVGVGGSHGAAQITKMQAYRTTSGTIGVYWVFQSESVSNDRAIFSTTTTLALGEEFFLVLIQDCTNRRFGFKKNDDAVEWVSWSPPDPWQIPTTTDPARHTFINVASSLVPGLRDRPMGGNMSHFVMYDGAAVMPTRWFRWNLDASLAFGAGLSNPSDGAVIGAIADTTMTMTAP